VRAIQIDAGGARNLGLLLELRNLSAELRQPLLCDHAATSLVVTLGICDDERQEKRVDRGGDPDASSARSHLRIRVLDQVSVRSTHAVSSGRERHLGGRSTDPTRWTRAQLEEHTEIVLVGKDDFGKSHLPRLAA
jgi:hypothetical protein